MTHTLSPRLGRDDHPRSFAAHAARPGASVAVSQAPIVPTVPEDWAVFQPLSATSHLVVGPGGIFTISVHRLAGDWAWVDKRTLLIAGRRTAHLRDAELDAARVTELLRARIALRAPVRPVVTLIGARLLGRGKAAASVAVPVLAEAALADWLICQPRVLRAGERMDLAGLIDHPGTWGTHRAFGPGLPSLRAPSELRVRG
ncbi:hypothetical protein E3T55_10345 [Cryobacterium frigoriphilum]|uniref:PABS domain-containing protein n=1 Tax=Cryobacterium frigoriphilum TaxID=1259150 RepID=A0A4R9A1A7_9MICO|nr:hypothetical protein [Cryobacterium frigoriphilum]TFD50290.1 hypothetical protein E3T55_10345 [Cryobacterium frigoriphilum]